MAKTLDDTALLCPFVSGITAPKDFRLGVELEYFPVHLSDLSLVPYDADPGVRDILYDLVSQYGWSPVYAGPNVIELLRGAERVTLQPGGVIEYSSPPLATVWNIERAMSEFLEALTTVVYISASLTATLLFLQSKYVAAFLVATLVAQLWRPLSECLRADYRGAGTMSAYQVMGLAMVPYALLLVWYFSSGPVPVAHLAVGLRALWNPLLVVVLECLWGCIFVYFGWSTVTESTLRFHVRSEEI